MLKQLSLCACLSLSTMALADVDSIAKSGGMTANSLSNLNASTTTAPANNQSDLQQQQLQNLLQMNLPAQIQTLQQTVQMLQGTLEMQAHQIQQLQQQLAKVTGGQGASDNANSDEQLQSTPVMPVSSGAGAMGSSPSVSPIASLSSDKVSQQQMVSAGSNDDAKPAAQAAPTNNDQPAATASEKAMLQSASNPQADSEQQLYQSAYVNVQNKKYGAAIAGMKAYLNKYPAGQFAANAHYWLGELYLISGDNKDAVNEFSNVVNQTKNPGKIPDAMLKLAMIAMSNQDYAAAKKQFNQITDKYPDTPAARIASDQLDQLAKSGY